MFKDAENPFKDFTTEELVSIRSAARSRLFYVEKEMIRREADAVIKQIRAMTLDKADQETAEQMIGSVLNSILTDEDIAHNRMVVDYLKEMVDLLKKEPQAA